jgi:hypothetical protein
VEDRKSSFVFCDPVGAFSFPPKIFQHVWSGSAGPSEPAGYLPIDWRIGLFPIKAR